MLKRQMDHVHQFISSNVHNTQMNALIHGCVVTTTVIVQTAVMKRTAVSRCSFRYCFKSTKSGTYIHVVRPAWDWGARAPYTPNRVQPILHYGPWHIGVEVSPQCSYNTGRRRWSCFSPLALAHIGNKIRWLGFLCRRREALLSLILCSP